MGASCRKWRKFDGGRIEGKNVWVLPSLVATPGKTNLDLIILFWDLLLGLLDLVWT
jgi:hypothetical protein